MENLSYDYYKSSFGGDLSPDDFNTYVSNAQNVISLMISSCSLPEGGVSDHYLRAVCIELEFLAKFDKCASFDGRAALRESLGDYSVTYSGDKHINIDGVPVSSNAILCLRQAGLFSRWI